MIIRDRITSAMRQVESLGLSIRNTDLVDTASAGHQVWMLIPFICLTTY
jgi:hypothetical protein